MHGILISVSLAFGLKYMLLRICLAKYTRARAEIRAACSIIKWLIYGRGRLKNVPWYAAKLALKQKLAEKLAVKL